MTRPMTWNIGTSQSRTLSFVTSALRAKLSPVKKALRSERITPLDRPEVPEV